MKRCGVATWPCMARKVALRSQKAAIRMRSQLFETGTPQGTSSASIAASTDSGALSSWRDTRIRLSRPTNKRSRLINSSKCTRRHDPAPTYKRLGELYEERGNRDKAVEFYSEFVDLWEGADAELQPLVEDVRGRIARLISER